MKYIMLPFGAIILAVVLRMYVFDLYTVPTGSMNPAIAVGDFIFAIKKSHYDIYSASDKDAFSNVFVKYYIN